MINLKLFYLIFFLLSIAVGGCSIGHKPYARSMDNEIGNKMIYRERFRYENSGELIRGNFGLAGEGLIDITKNENGDLIYHFHEEEILPIFHTKEWVGKCLIYYVVDPKTYIIKAWGFDAGGNSLSCRIWM